MARKNRYGLVSKIEFVIAKMIILAMQHTPRKVSLAIGSIAGRIFWALVQVKQNRLNQVIENLRHLYPDKPEKELCEIIKKVCRHFARAFTQYTMLENVSQDQLEKIVEFEGFENFEKAWAMNKGAIFATAHFGNFEVANGIFASKGYPVASTIRTVDNPYLDKLLDDIREGTGLKVIKKEKAVPQIMRHLRNKGIVTVNIDMNAGVNQMFVPFFGELASTFSTPAMFGVRIGSPILPVFSFRDDQNDKYIVRIYPMIEIESTGNKKADIRLITMKINEALESAIVEAPEQWLWVHRRWKTRPTDEDTLAHNRDMEIIASSQEVA